MQNTVWMYSTRSFSFWQDVDSLKTGVGVAQAVAHGGKLADGDIEFIRFAAEHAAVYLRAAPRDSLARKAKKPVIP